VVTALREVAVVLDARGKGCIITGTAGLEESEGRGVKRKIKIFQLLNPLLGEARWLS
jgi:hypothetical protein